MTGEPGGDERRVREVWGPTLLRCSRQAAFLVRLSLL